MTNRAYDWMAEAEREALEAKRSARRAARRAWARRHQLAIMIVTWFALMGLGFFLGLLTGGRY